jgi:soluble P-type ATPase
MLEIQIPDFGELRLEHLVLDYNGTLACDGELEPGVLQNLQALQQKLQVHIVTADTFGKVRASFAGTPFKVTVLSPDDQAGSKQAYVRELGATSCVCMGNGRNDRLMLAEAGLGVAVMLKEGLSREAMLAADVSVTGIVPALELLQNPLRLTATLRS